MFLVIATSGFFPFMLKKKEQPRRYVVCHPIEVPADDNMKAFAADPVFQALHPSPLSIVYEAQGSMVQFSTPDGKEASGYLIRSEKRTSKWLFVFQEWWGLNDHIKKEADRLFAELGGAVNVIALDMYDGKVATDPKEAGKLVQGAVEERLENIVKGARAFAGKKALIANIGWCFGGGWSLRSALINGDQTIGTVMYYGMPVKDVEKLKTLHGDVLGLFATEAYISKAVIEEFERNMNAAGKVLKYTIYDAAHGFANPSNPRFDKVNAENANSMALAYLKSRFGIK